MKFHFLHNKNKNKNNKLIGFPQGWGVVGGSPATFEGRGCRGTVGSL
jgi:hypothetical protein